MFFITGMLLTIDLNSCNISLTKFFFVKSKQSSSHGSGATTKSPVGHPLHFY